MKNVDELDAALRSANPVQGESELPSDPARTDALLLLIKKRSGIMHDTHQPGSAQRTPTPAPPKIRSRRGLLVAAAAFVAVLAVGATLTIAQFGDNGSDGAAPGRFEETAELAALRAAVNAGDAVAAASIHTDEGDCDRQFTTGTETCADWYAFLVAIGTQVTAVDCDSFSTEADGVGCNWTLESDAHRALGIDSVEWRSLVVYIEGWATAVPDGNLFTGIPGVAALDADFWKFVSETLPDEPSDSDKTFESPLKVQATLNGDFATVVLEAAKSFPDAAG